MGNARHDESSVSGNAQQGSGGIASGQATSTPDQRGSQPHLGSQAGQAGQAGDAAGGTGENEGNNDDRVGIPGGPDEVDAVDEPRNH